MQLTPVTTALEFIDNAVTAITLRGDAIEVERLGASLFQSFNGSGDDAIRFGKESANARMDQILDGAVVSSLPAVAIVHANGQVGASWIMRPNSVSTIGDVVQGRELIGRLGAPELISHNPAVKGIVAGGQWFPL